MINEVLKGTENDRKDSNASYINERTHVNGNANMSSVKD